MDLKIIFANFIYGGTYQTVVLLFKFPSVSIVVRLKIQKRKKQTFKLLFLLSSVDHQPEELLEFLPKNEPKMTSMVHK